MPMPSWLRLALKLLLMPTTLHAAYPGAEPHVVGALVQNRQHAFFVAGLLVAAHQGVAVGVDCEQGVADDDFAIGPGLACSIKPIQLHCPAACIYEISQQINATR